MRNFCRNTAFLSGILVLHGCGGGGDSGAGSGSGGTTSPPQTFSVGGSLSGLPSGATIQLLNNGADTLNVSANGSLTFSQEDSTGAAYSVTIAMQPSGAACTVSDGSGSVATSDVTSVVIDCGPYPALDSVYVSNTAQGNISGFSVDSSTGSLSLIQGGPFPGNGELYSLAVDTGPGYVYAAVSNGGYVQGFTISPDAGALTAFSGQPFFTGLTPISIAIDPTKKFVFTANSSSNNVSVFMIGTGGALTEVTGSPFAAGREPSFVVADPAGAFVYVANATDGTVSAYALDKTSGAFTPVPGSPFPSGGTQPQSIAIDPSGATLYVGNTASSTIGAFAIDPSSGALSAIGGSPYTTNGVLQIAVAPSGEYVYVAAALNVSGYSRSAVDGSLTVLSGSPFQLPNNARAIALAIEHTGGYLYALDNANGDVNGFSINASTGALAPVAGSPFPLVAGKQGVGFGSTSIVTSP